MIKRLRPTLEENLIFPDHQFGFRQQHSTVEQVHRFTEKIRRSYISHKSLIKYGTQASSKLDKPLPMHTTEH
jgi:hypothetical protein